MQCNIDAKGRAVRLVIGSAVEGAGLLVGLLWYMDSLPAWTIYPAIGITLGGQFMVFEGMSGWCAIRAMGIKTTL